MSTNSALACRSLRVLGAAALLTVSTFASQRAVALSPVNPGPSAVSKAAADGLTIEVRGSHGGGGGSGRGGSGGWGGSRSVGAAVVSGGAIGTRTVAAGAPRFAGHAFVHRRHFRGVFIDGVYYDDYPYDDDADYFDNPAAYPAFVAGAGCRRVMTVHGLRVVCRHRIARHHYRRHHHA